MYISVSHDLELMAKRIQLKYPQHTELVCLKRVAFLMAQGSSTVLHIMEDQGAKPRFQSGHIGLFEPHLPKCFLRIRDNVIINLRYVERFTPDRTIFLNTPARDKFVVPKKRWPQVKHRLAGQLVISF